MKPSCTAEPGNKNNQVGLPLKEISDQNKIIVKERCFGKDIKKLEDLASELKPLHNDHSELQLYKSHSLSNRKEIMSPF